MHNIHVYIVLGTGTFNVLSLDISDLITFLYYQGLTGNQVDSKYKYVRANHTVSQLLAIIDYLFVFVGAVFVAL